MNFPSFPGSLQPLQLELPLQLQLQLQVPVPVQARPRHCQQHHPCGQLPWEATSWPPTLMQWLPRSAPARHQKAPSAAPAALALAPSVDPREASEANLDSVVADTDVADVEVVHVDGAAPVVPCVAPDAPTDAVPLVPPVPGAPVPLRPAAAGRHELEPEVVALVCKVDKAWAGMLDDKDKP